MANWNRSDADGQKKTKFFQALRALVQEENSKIEEHMRLVRSALRDPYVIRYLLTQKDEVDPKKRYPIHYLVEAAINFEEATQEMNLDRLRSPKGRVFLGLLQAVNLVTNNRNEEQMILCDANGENTLNKIYKNPMVLHLVGSNTLSNFTSGFFGSGGLLDVPFCSIRDERGFLPIHSLLENFNSKSEEDFDLVALAIITLVRAGNPSLCGARPERNPEIFTEILNEPSPISGKPPLQIIIEKGLTQAFIAGCEGYLPHSVGPFSLPLERSRFNLNAKASDGKPLYLFLLDRYCSALEDSEALQGVVDNKYAPMLECVIRLSDESRRKEILDFLSKRVEALSREEDIQSFNRVSDLNDRVIAQTTPNPSFLSRAFEALTGRRRAENERAQ